MGEKDFRVRKGLVVDGTSYSTVAGKLAVGLEEAGTPSASHSNILRVSGNTSTSNDSGGTNIATLPTAQPQLLVKTQNNGHDAVVRILGRRNGSTIRNQAVLQFGNHDDNGTTNGGINYANLGAIAGSVSDSDLNIGDMKFFTYADGETASERMIIKHDGKIGIATTSPEALLDVNTGSGIAIQMGADVNATTLTNDTRKYGRFATPHYHNAEEPIGLVVGDSDGTDNIVNIGGGSNAVNAATIIRFWSAADDATVTGTERMRITSGGNVGIGTDSPDYDLHVVGSGYFTDDLRVGAETPGKITLNGNDAFVQGQFEASGTAGSYIYSLALGGETPTTTSGEILGAKATFSGSSAGDYEALKLVNTDDTNDAAVTSLHMSNERGVDSAFFLEHDAFGNTKMFTGQGSSVATSAGSDMNLGITIKESGAVRISDAFDFPTALGNPGQVLKVPSSGSVLEWANDNSGSGSSGATILNELTDVLISNNSLLINNFGSAPVESIGINTAADNIGIGDTALNSITMGDDNIGLGREALTAITIGLSNIAIGALAGNATTSSINNAVFIGGNAGRRMDGDDNIAIGRNALEGSATNTNNTGTFNVGIGTFALRDTTSADKNVAIGYAPLQNATTGGFNVAIGSNTLSSITTGSGNVAIGSSTADLLTDGVSNVAIGAAMGDVDTGIDYNVALGYRAGRYLGSDDNVAIGKDALVGSTTATDNTGTRNVAIGKNVMDGITSGSDNVAIGFHAAGAVTSGANHVAIGREALSTVTSNSANTAVGYQAGKNLSGTGNIAFGPQALLGLSTGTINGEYNIAMGYQPMWEMQTGDKNLAIGFEAMQMIRTGNSNIAVGNETMKEVYDSADHNITLGYQAGYYIGNNDNVAIGYQAMKGSTNAQSNSGSKNIAIGYTAMESYTTATDNIAIGRNALGDVTTGDNNIAIGEGALSATDVAASDNIMMGYFAGTRLKGGINVGIGSNAVAGSTTVADNTGTYNVGIGHFNLSVITTGSDNIGLGQLALRNVSTGNQNIGIGQDAGTAITTGSGNIVIGKDSGDSITDGNYNVLIGEDAGQDITSGDDNLIIHAGNNQANAPSSATANEQLQISSGNKTWLQGYDGVLYFGRNNNYHIPAGTSSADTQGGVLRFGGGAGTGTAKGGDLKLQYTPPSGSSSSTHNSYSDALTVHGDTGNVTIHNNLIVSGDSITVNAETITTEEAMLSLGIGQTATDADALDFGFYGTYDVGDTQKFRGVFADASASGKFKFFKDLEVEPTTTVNTGGAGFALADVKAATFEGNLTGNVTGNLTGNATGAHSGTLAGNATTATTATNVVVSANNSTDETVYPLFVDGATGTQGAETDTGLTYNPSTGMLTATGFTGALTGNADTATTAATVTSGTQSNITSLGTLTSLTGGTGDLAWDTDTLFVDSSADRVGMGNSSPETTLHVSYNKTTTGPLGTAQLLVEPTSATGQDASIEVRGARNSSTTAVPASIKLTNYDNDLTDTNTLGAVVGKVTNHSTNVGSLILQTSADGSALSDRLTITSAGNVGIGTTSPGTSLHLSDAAEVTLSVDSSHATGAQISLDATGTGGDEWRIVSGANNAGIGGGAFGLYNVDTTSYRFNVTSAGNVGIGTTAPDQKLHVEGSILADAYNFATTTLASNYTDGETSLVLTDASQFPTAGSGTIVDSSENEAVEFTWTGKSSNTLTVPDLNNNYTAGVTVVADTGLFFRDGFENVAQPSVTIYDKDNNGASRDDLSINANAGIRFRLGNQSQMQLTTDQLSLTTGNQSAAAIFGFRDRVDMGIKSNTSYSVGVLAPDNVFIQADSNNNGNANYIDFGHGSNVVGSAESMMRIVMDGATGTGKIGMGTTSPAFPLHLKYTDNDTAPEGGSTSGSGTIGANAEGGGLYIENASTTDGSYAGITFRTDTADARIAYQSVGSSLINEGQMSFYLDTNDADSNTPSSVYTLEEVLRLRGGSSDSDSAQAFNSAYVNGRLGVGTASPNQPLTVEGTMSLKEQASANSDTAAYGQLWVKTATPNELYFTTDAGDDIQITSGTSLAGGSGGGSGDIEGVTAGTGISGGGTTGTVTVNLDIDGLTDIGGSLALDDKIPVYDLSGTAIKKMDVSRLNGVLSELRIRDARNEGATTSSEMLPAEFSDKSAVFTFTDDIANSTNAWDSVITMKGWSTNYRVWQLFSASDASSNSVDTEPLYFRTGEEDENSGNWGVRREILTFPGTTPNADGSANQILQTNGSGTLSWADISAAPSGFAVTGDLNVGSGDFFVDDSAGEVGIGTTSTVAPLTVQTAANDVEALRVQNSAGNPGGVQGITRLGISSRLEAVAGAQIIAKEMDVADYRTDMIFATKATNASSDAVTDRMIIRHNGNVGIGTTSPDARLHVSTGTDLDCGIIIEADTDNNDEADLPFLWMKQDGDITAHAFQGTSNKLQIINNISASGGIDFLTGTTNNTGTTNPATSATVRLHIASDGDIGVGTTSPSFASGSGIEVSNATQANLRLTDSNGGSTDFAVQGNDAYILNRHASGKIIIKPGNGDHSIELASDGQVKFNNAYTFPTSDGSPNQVLTTNGSGALSFADAGGSSGTDMKKFVAIQNTGTGDATTLINVNNTTAQTITWLSEIHKDSIFTHSTSTNPGEITVTEDGTYLIDYSINTENTGTNRFVGHARVFVNGTALNYTLATSYSRGSGFDDDMVAHWSGVVELSANDVVTVRMRKNDADQTSQVQVQQDGTYISLLKLSGQATNTFVIVGEESDDYISAEAGAGNANGFIMSYGNGAQNTTKSSSGSDFGVVIPAGCTLSRIDITFGNKGSETNSSNQTLTVFKNRSASTTTMTYNASGSGGNAFVKSFSSLSGDGLSYAAGDTFNIRATGLAGYTDTQVGPARMTAYFTVD